MSAPDPDLSTAALDVRHEVARLDREYREEHGRPASGPELARLLLAAYAPRKKRWWRQ